MELTRKHLKSRIHYNPETGAFTWTAHSWARLIGSTAGSVDYRGYVIIRVGHKAYFAHRLAWFYMRGRWPKDEIDHINGNRADNRFSNIRCANRMINSQNMQGPRVNNKHGYLGIQPKDGKWVVRIQSEYKIYRLGKFATPEEASRVYLDAKRKLHKGCTI